MNNPLQTIKHLDIAPLLESYREIAKKDKLDGFNVFTLTSDLYYRENYHSDILTGFLRYKDEGSGRYILLEAFIEMLNAARKSDNKASIGGFSNPVIEREQNRIDILIKDENTTRCIIIENKINDAVDMPRQLPRYYEIMSQVENCHVDAIVYLTLIPDKLPDRRNWSKADCESIDCRLIPIPVVNSENKISLLANWVNPNLTKISDLDVRIPFVQYGRLLEKLSNNMNKLEKVKELSRVLQDTDKNESLADDVFSLRDMINLLPEAMADDLGVCLLQYKTNEKLPFEILKWQPNSCVVNLGNQNMIYVYCQFNQKEAYEVGISDFSKNDRLPNWLNERIEQQHLETFSPHKISIDAQGGLKYEFGYKEKSLVISFVKKLISLFQDSKK
ncbi:MAG: PD-(D/E)XK nuclease family protein [Muribaculaceae bacterium]|nr:PD-(D/E)XK nuclease family protein [Muribaculaceae bacterium]